MVEPLPAPPDEQGQVPKKRGAQKKIWMLTYCPAGTYITPDILKSHDIIADECHSTADRVMNYTYLHLEKKVRQTRIQAVMDKLKDTHGITLNEVFGYEPISSDSRHHIAPVRDHIVFKMLLNHCKSKNPSFKPNTDGEPILKRGNLFQALDATTDRTVALQFQTKKNLIKHIQEIEKKLEEAKVQEAEHQDVVTTFLTVVQERSDLFMENSRLKRKVAELEEALSKRPKA